MRAPGVHYGEYPASTPLVVLGVGNLLLSDDGAGVRAARLLAAEPAGLPAGAEVIDGGTGGLNLLPAVRGAGALLVVDAVEVHATPGSIQVLTGADLYADLLRLSVHQVGVSDLLAAIRLSGAAPPRAALVGVQPASLEPGVTLSPAVEAALPRLVDAVRACAQRLVAADEAVR